MADQISFDDLDLDHLMISDEGDPTLKLAALLVPRRHTPAVVGLDG
jgi:hypothetical protein